MITSLEQMADKVRQLDFKRRIAVAWGQDSHTIKAVHKAVTDGIAEVFLIGNTGQIINICRNAGIDETPLHGHIL